jgi:hypothetical protein
MSLFGIARQSLPRPTFENVGDVWQITLTQDSKEIQEREFIKGVAGGLLYWPPSGGRPCLLEDIPGPQQAMARPLMQLFVEGVTPDGVAMESFIKGRQLKAVLAAVKVARQTNPEFDFPGFLPAGTVLALKFESEDETAKTKFKPREWKAIVQFPAGE